MMPERTQPRISVCTFAPKRSAKAASDDGDASKVAPVGKGDKAAPLSDVGFKPIRSPLDEHRAGLGATLLNKSVGKGSAKFKGAAAASAAPGAAADSKGVL